LVELTDFELYPMNHLSSFLRLVTQPSSVQYQQQQVSNEMESVTCYWE